jgi:hypothetical protein
MPPRTGDQIDRLRPATLRSLLTYLNGKSSYRKQRSGIELRNWGRLARLVGSLAAEDPPRPVPQQSRRGAALARARAAHAARLLAHSPRGRLELTHFQFPRACF